MSATGTGTIQRCAIASVTIIAVLTAAAEINGPLRLDVKVMPSDPSRVIIGAPGSKMYVGFLKNTGKFPLLVQIMPMPERERGNGKCGACYLERWDVTSHRWVYLPAPTMTLESVPVYALTLKSGDAIDVCGYTLANEPGQSGRCYRFTLQVQLKGFGSPSILSQTFKVGAQTKGLRAGCHP